MRKMKAYHSPLYRPLIDWGCGALAAAIDVERGEGAASPFSFIVLGSMEARW